MNKLNNMKRNKLKQALNIALLTSSLGLASLANAISFNKGDLTASWDTTVSYGVAFRAAERDDALVGKSNLNPFIGAQPLDQQIAAPGRFSINSDNGNLNYDQWDKIRFIRCSKNIRRSQNSNVRCLFI